MLDPIVEEIHKIRKEYAEKFDFDVDAMFQDLHKKQTESNREIVSFAKNDNLKKSDNDKKAA